MSIYDSNEYFKSYFTSASEKTLLIDLMTSRFIPAAVELKILDLGCHDGALIKKIINTYAKIMPDKVRVTGIDPSLDALLEYTKNQFDIPVQTTPFLGTAEHFFLRKPQDEYFDWVIASQCLYWSLNLPSIVRQIADCGESGLIVLRGRRGIYEIQSRFKDYIGNPNEQFYTAEDIASALLDQNIPFDKELKTTSISLPHQGSIEMKWLISFFLQQDKQEIISDIWVEVESWILEKTSGHLEHDVCFFWLGNARHKR